MPPKKSDLSRRSASLRRKSLIRLQETEEQRQNRLENLRARAASRRASETPEQHQRRLEVLRIRAATKRKGKRRRPTVNKIEVMVGLQNLSTLNGEQNKPKHPANIQRVNINSQNISALSGVWLPSNKTELLNLSSPAFPPFETPPLPKPSEMEASAVQNEPLLEEEHDPLYIGSEHGMGTTDISDIEEKLNLQSDVGTVVKLEIVEKLNPESEEGTTVKSETEEGLDSETSVWTIVKSETDERLDIDFTAP